MTVFKRPFISGPISCPPLIAAMVLLLAVPAAAAQQPRCNDAKPTNSSKIAPDGTAYVTRIVPVPSTISLEAQKFWPAWNPMLRLPKPSNSAAPAPINGKRELANNRKNSIR